MCGHTASWRCTDCIGAPAYCAPCLRAAHLRLPFHRVEHWTGTHFRRSWLRTVGVQIHCGHGGEPCPTHSYTQSADINSEWTSSGDPADPEALSAQIEDADREIFFVDEDPEGLEDENMNYLFDELDDDPSLAPLAELPVVGEPVTGVSSSAELMSRSRSLVIIDITGVHELPVVFCRCPNHARDDLQLLSINLYPASSVRPRTAFTTRLLDDFLLDNKETHTSPRNYFNKLRRMTNAAFPHMAPVRSETLTFLLDVLTYTTGSVSRASPCLQTVAESQVKEVERLRSPLRGTRARRPGRPLSGVPSARS